MALSAQNDTGQSGAEDNSMVKQQDKVSQIKDKSFIPNPDAKAFVPTPDDIKSFHNNREETHKCSTNDALMMCNFDRKHDSGIGLDNAMYLMSFEIMNGMNLGTGVSAPVSMTHSSPNSEDNVLPPMDVHLVTNGDSQGNKTNKKHIAYHVLSNLLDDEISEDAKNVGQDPQSKMEQNDVFEGVCSWPASVSSLSSSFSLNLDLPDLSNQASFSNRSIHEIWSPNPSPKGSYPSTPSDESLPYFPNSHDNRDSPYHNRSPVDILAGRGLGSPMLVSPCSLPSEQSMMQHHSLREASPFFNSKFSSIDIVNNNNAVHNGIIHNGHSYDNGATQKQGMRAIRALQFIDPGIETDLNGKDTDAAEYMPAAVNLDDSGRHEQKVKRHQVHFEDKPRNGIIKPKNGHVVMSKDEMMTAAKRLGSGLDECLDQLRNLERECRKAEQELSRIYPSRRRSSSSAGSYHSRVPSNPTRVDKMIYEQLKVHDKIESLIGRIERLGRTPLHSNVGVALDRWLACIRELQNLRKDEICNSPGSQVGSYGCKSYDDRDLLALANCVKDLVVHTRAARTTVWCATQMLHAEEYWIVRPSESCGSLERNSDQLSEKS